MNKIHSVIWSHALSSWIVTSEHSRKRGKRSGQLKLLATSLLLAPFSLMAATLPENGSITLGAGSISTPSSHEMLINQNSQKMAIDWHSFNIAPGSKVTFQQPDSQSIALNRVLGTDPSAIYGILDANGQVFLINPNGVLIGKGAQVNVGGLVASTLELSNEDFLKGNFTFKGNGNPKGILNQGAINAHSGGAVALLGGHVSNEGLIVANMGTVALASGNAITLDFAGDGLLNVQIDEATKNALVENKHLIQADGGRVVMTAQGSDALLKTVVNNTGVIQARTVESKNGEIILLGGFDGGVVDVAGTLDASASDIGDGGYVETSGAVVRVAQGATVTTKAQQGKTGSWVIDPTDLTVTSGSGPKTGSSIGADTLSANLQNTNVELQTVAAGSEAGNINVEAAVSWSADTKLTLTAHNNINLNADISATGQHAEIALNHGQMGTITGSDYRFNNGAKITLSGSNAKFSENGTSYMVIHNLAELQNIQSNLFGNYVLGNDIDASATLGWNAGTGFIPIGDWSDPFEGKMSGLGNSISNLYINRPTEKYVGLFGSAYGSKIRSISINNANIIGLDDTGALVGNAEDLKAYDIYSSGQISGLGNNTGGLIGLADNVELSSSHSIANVAGVTNTGGLLGLAYFAQVLESSHQGNVDGATYTGGLIGRIDSGEVIDSYANGTVTGTVIGTGGLLGYNNGEVVKSYAAGSVTGIDRVGGLIGLSNGTVSDSHASGTVEGEFQVGGLVGLSSGLIERSHSSSNVSGHDLAGGLVGGSNNLIKDSYATGDVFGLWSKTGGLVGHSNDDIENSYATGDVTGRNGAGGLVGQLDGYITSSYSTGNVTGLQYVGGLVGYSIGGTIIDQTYATGSADGTNHVGGLVGSSEGYIRNSFATGNAKASNQNAGGLVGLAGADSTHPDSILNSYATGAAEGLTNVGGLVGLLDIGATVKNTYALGTITGTNNTGGLVGFNNSGSITNSHWLKVNDSNGFGKTFEELQKSSTFAGWDLDNQGGTGATWRIYEGDTTPLLRAFLTSITATPDSASTVYSGTNQVNGVDYVSDYTLSGIAPSFWHPSSLLNQGLVSGSITTQTPARNAGIYALNNGLSSTQFGYDISYAGAQLTIDQATVVLSVADVNKVYDGSTQANGILTLLAGTQLLGSDSASGTFEYLDKNAGTGKTVSITDIVINDGNSGNNYSVTLVDNTNSSIDAKTIDVSASAADKVYDGTTSVDFELTANNLVSGDDIAFSGTGSFSDQHAGANKTVNISAITANGLDAGNYVFNTSTDTSASIDKAQLVLSSADITKVYDGTTQANGVISAIDGTQLFGSDSITSGSLEFLDKNAGSGKTVTLKGLVIDDGNAGNNYDISLVDNQNSTIEAKIIDVSAVAADKIYDGTVSASIALISADTLSGDDIDFSGTASFADKHAGLGKDVHVTEIKANGLDAGNYVFNTTAATTATIDKAQLVFSVADSSKTYDGTTALSGSLVASDGTQLFESDSIVSGHYEFLDKNAGTGKTVTIKDLLIDDGNAGNNYNVNVIENHNSSIQAKVVDVNALAHDKTYDGTTSATIELNENDVIAGDDVTLSGVASFDTKHAGNGKTVTVEITASGLDSGNYEFNTTAQATASIDKAQLVISIDDVTKVYDGTTAAEGVAIAIEGTQLFDTDSVVSGTYSYLNKHAGTGKTVTVSNVIIDDGNSGSNYNLILKDNFSSSIQAKTVDVTALADDKIYDGTSSATFELYAGDIISGDDIAFNATGLFLDKHAASNKKVEIYDIVGSGGDALNYLFNTTTETTASILKKDVTVSVSDVNKVYDGTTAAQGLPVFIDGGLEGSDSITSGSYEFLDKNAGVNKTVTIKDLVIDDGNLGNNYNINVVDNHNSSIDAKTIEVSAVADNKFYDGNDSATTVLNGTDIISGDDITFSGDGYFADKHAGTDKAVSVIGITGHGADAGNYTFNTTAEATASIHKADLVLSANDITKVYDGTTDADGVAVAIDGTQLFDSDSVSSSTFAFTDKNAGSGKTVSVTHVVIDDGNNGDNYNIVLKDNLNSTIEAKVIDVSAVADNKVYDGTSSSSVNLNGSGIIAGDDISFSGTGEFSDKNAGANKTVHVSGITGSGTDAGNYAYNSSTDTTATINKAQLVLSVDDISKVYDGSRHADGTLTLLDGTQLFGSDSVSGSLEFQDKNAGTAKVVSIVDYAVEDGNSGNNYDISVVDNTSSSIQARLIEVAAQADDKVYDGSTLATIALTANDIVSGDDLTFNGNAFFSDKNAGSGKQVSVTGITAGGSDAGNYTFNTTADTSATIEKAQLTLTVSDITKVYDGTTTANGGVILAADGTQLIGADAIVSATYGFLDKNAGVGKAVSITEVVIDDGNGGSNYTVSLQDSLNSTIQAKAIDVFALANDKVYDGTASASFDLDSTGIISGDDIAFSGTGAFSDKHAGTGKSVNITDLIASGADAGNYVINTSTDTTATIHKAQLVLSSSDISKVYDGTNQATGSLMTLDGTSLFGSDVASGSLEFEDKNAGTGKIVTLSDIVIDDGNAGNNYTVTAVNNTNSTIHAKEINFSANAEDKVYDGNASAVFELASSGVIAGDDIGFTGNAVFDSKHAGINKAVAVSISASGLDVNNYVFGQPALVTASIYKKDLTASAVSDARSYNGNVSSSGQVLFAGLVGGDTAEGSQVFDSKHAGNRTTKVDQVRIEDGNGGNNYNLLLTDATGVINKAALFVEANNASKNKGAADPTLGWSLTGGALYGSDSLSGSLTREAGEAIGTYKIDLGTLSAGANYDMTFQSGSLSIVEAPSIPVEVPAPDVPIPLIVADHLIRSQKVQGTAENILDNMETINSVKNIDFKVFYQPNYEIINDGILVSE